MDFGCERGTVVALSAGIPLACVLVAHVWACARKAIHVRSPAYALLQTLVGALAGILLAVWANAVPCLALRCDRSSLDNVGMRVLLLVSVGPVVAALVVAFSSLSAPDEAAAPLLPTGVPYVVGVRVSHVPPRWLSGNRQ